jgi:hypothetical protein
MKIQGLTVGSGCKIMTAHSCLLLGARLGTLSRQKELTTDPFAFESWSGSCRIVGVVYVSGVVRPVMEAHCLGVDHWLQRVESVGKWDWGYLRLRPWAHGILSD